MEVRFDRGQLQRPWRKGSALVIEGIAARVHKPGDPLRYAHGDEYRDLAELERIVSQLPGKPVVLPHPPKLIKRGAKPRVVGRVDAAWLDGELAAVRLTIMDGDAIAAVESGTKQLSLGYEVSLDAAGYQRDTDVDHTAIIPAARCGDACSLRTDERMDCSATCGCSANAPVVAGVDDRFRDDIARARRDGALLCSARELANRPPERGRGG